MVAAPGPEADRDSQPELWALLRDLAERLGVPPPDSVFLIADVNAYVVQNKRLFRSAQLRLLLGMGILHLLTRPQLAAVLAHELAHLHHGDADEAPGRNMARDLFSLTAKGLAGSALGDLALKGLHATQHKSREAELAADAAAARLVGRELYTEALVRSTLGTSLFELFMHQDVGPLLEIGCVPDNLFDGFVPFVDAAAPTQGAGLSATLAAAATQLGDSHPALMDRLVHLKSVEEATAPLVIDDGSALDLLRDREALERQATDAWTGRLPVMGPLRPVAWGDVAEHVLTPWMVERADMIADRAQAEPVLALRRLLARLDGDSPAALARELEPALATVDDETAGQLFAVFLGHLLAGVLLRHGGTMVYSPGTPATVVREGERFETGTLAAEALGDAAHRAALLDALPAAGDA
jgi:Zn-dependent protease with chaperone function